MEISEIKASIEQSTFLSGYSFLSENALVRHYEKGCIVYDEVDGMPCVALIHTGEVAVLFACADGREIHLNTLKRGHCFGVSNLLCAQELCSTLQCKTAVTIIYIAKNTVVQTMEKSASLAMRYAGHCNEKINFLIHRIELLTIQSSREKVIRHLLLQKNEENRVCFGCTKERLASYLGISRAAIYRELRFLQSKNLITLGKNAVFILDESALIQIIEQKGI